MKDAANSRIMVLGLDGGTWQIFKPLLDLGVMPHLQTLVEQGAHGVLKSVVPSVTAPAWASFATGNEPVKHGIFDFRQFSPKNHRESFVNSTSIHGETLWKVLSRAGKKSLIVNVPITFPVQPINGIMISGMMSPGISGKLEPEFCYPFEYGKKLAKQFPDYRMFVSQDIFYKEGLDAFISKLVKGVENRLALSLHLMEENPWDFFMVHFQNLDSLQHALWPALMKMICEMQSGKMQSHRILDYFRKLDTAIGRLAGQLSENDVLIVLSDHGFGPLNRFFNLNAWLINQGLLALNKTSAWEQVQLKLYKKILRALYRCQFDQNNFLNKILYRLKNKLNLFENLQVIDWQQTKLFSPFGPQIFGLIYFMPEFQHENLRADLINEISTKIRKIKDPENNEEIAEEIYQVSKYLQDPVTEKSPDLIIQLKPGYICNSCAAESGVFRAANLDRGTHQIDGMVVFHGHNIRNGLMLKNARIIDLMPTILSIFNIPIRNEIDGRILTEVFEIMLPKNGKAVHSFGNIDDKSNEYVYNEAESEQIARHLKNLGYLN